jgi:hypothetical protein
MKTGKLFVATLALAALPLAAQQTPQSNTQQSSPAAQQGTSPTQPGAVPEQTTTPEQPATPAARPETSAVPEAAAAPTAEMRPVNGELVSKLDTKTAKTGDDVVVQTKSAVKTADGTEIPKGSKLMGHVLAVQASSGGQNSQVVLKFDHAELAGGQSLPIHSEIRSIGSSDSAAVASDSGAMSSPSTSAPSSPGSSTASGGGMNGSSAATPRSNPSGGAMAAGTAAPAAGTIVARNGNIAISTTSVPGVLLANNAPGQQDPRMAQASSILLGAKKDVQLDRGTPLVVGVSADSSGAMK